MQTKTKIISILKFITSRVFFFFAGILCFIGTITVLATWPSLPNAEDEGGWLGRVFDLVNSGSDKLVITSGIVGIGNTNPQLPLDINPVDSSKNAAIGLTDLNNTKWKIATDNDLKGLTISKDEALASATFFIKEDGDVGIGTTSIEPNLTLKVGGRVGATEYCDINGNNCNNLGNGNVIVTESDPQVGTLQNGKWCTSNGSSVNCTSNKPSGINNVKFYSTNNTNQKVSQKLGSHSFCALSRIYHPHQSQACTCTVRTSKGIWHLDKVPDPTVSGNCGCSAVCIN